MAIRRVRRVPMISDLGLAERNGVDSHVALVARPLVCGCQPPFRDPSVPRCHVHEELLAQVLERWSAGTGWERKEIWQEADGLGRRGYVPPAGRFDITALNWSSPEAIERMYRVVIGLGPLDDGPLLEEDA